MELSPKENGGGGGGGGGGGKLDPKEAAAQVRTRSVIRNGWFSELIEGSASGQSMCLQIDEVLYQEKSDFQEILVFKRYLNIYYNVPGSGFYFGCYIIILSYSDQWR